MSFLIVGLGNPGRTYLHTRHNVGFMAVDRLASAWGATKVRRQCQAEVATATIEGQPVRLACPQTYVNRSGESLKCLVTSLKIPLTRLMVICDDFALPLGTIRLRPAGSDGGHNGLASIIQALETERVPRLRIGVGPVPPGITWVEFVLQPMDRPARERLTPVLDRTVEAVSIWIQSGIQRAMSAYNQGALA